MPQHELLETFVSPLEHAQIPYMITGSVAAIFYGEPRLTNDVDLVVHLSKHDLKKFMSCYPNSDYYCPPVEVLEIETSRSCNSHFNLIHHDSGLKADIYPLTRNPLLIWGMENRLQIEIKEGTQYWFAPVEYVIVKKMHFYKEGNSPKHISDIVNMLKSDLSKEQVLLITQFAAKTGVSDIWEHCKNENGQ